MPESLSHSSRPELGLDGQALGALQRDLQVVEVAEDTGGLRSARLRLAALGPAADGSGGDSETLNWLDHEKLKLGAEITVAMGPGDARTRIFKGRITRIGAVFRQSALPEVVVDAADALWDLRTTRRLKTWENQDAAGIANAIASEHGLTAQVDASGPTWKALQQWNSTDLAFLRQVAEAVGAELWLEDTTLHLAARESRGGETLALVMGGELLALDVDADLAHQRSSVAVSGFDADQKDKIDEVARPGDLGAVTGGGGTHGASALEEAFSERKTARLRDVPLVAAEATARAKAELAARLRRFVRARGVTTGTPALQVGGRLKLERVGKLFEGEGYVVVEAIHRFDLTAGYQTHFIAERPTVLVPGAGG